MHKRLRPKINAFSYGIYNICLPINHLDQVEQSRIFKINRSALMTFYEKDHGYRNGEPLIKWVDDMFQKCDLTRPEGEVMLITMPRIFGYVFNPVSFFCCFDKNETLHSVICEVNNTFGETHSYLCLQGNNDKTTADKIFHVSPFIERNGEYEFRFQLKEAKTGIWINHKDEDGPLLLTSVTGNLEPLTKRTIRKAFFSYPLLTFKAITLIHWQAIKLLLKGMKYINRPLQLKQKVSRTLGHR